MITLYLIRGVPGSGKSTLGQRLRDCGLVHTVIEADQYFVKDGIYKFNAPELSMAHSVCQDRTKTYLEGGFSVAVTNTSTTEKEVLTYKEMAEKYKAEFVSIIVENRHNGTNLHNVPEDKIQQMKNRFSIKL